MSDAVGAGRVPLPHLDALARVTATAGERAATELSRPETQARLVRMAERQSVREFGAAAARLVASFDPATLERTAEAQRRERFFVMSRQPEGIFLKGRLDHQSAEVLRTAIASVGQAPDDERTKAQADADALVALAERAVAGTAGVRARRTSEAGMLLPDDEQDAADARVSGVSNRPTVSILVPAETFADLRAAQQRREANAGDGSGDLDDAATRDWRPVEPAMLEDGTPLAMSQLARALCDCEVGRIVMSADRRAAGPRPHPAPLHRSAAPGGDRARSWLRLERVLMSLPPTARSTTSGGGTATAVDLDLENGVLLRARTTTTRCIGTT